MAEFKDPNTYFTQNFFKRLGAISEGDLQVFMREHLGDNNTSSTELFEALNFAICFVDKTEKVKNTFVEFKYLLAGIGEGMTTAQMQTQIIENLRDIVRSDEFKWHPPQDERAFLRWLQKSLVELFN